MKLTRHGLLTGVIVVAALFLGSWVVQLIPDADEQFGRPFEHRAAVGEPVEVRTGTVTVTGLTTAREIERLGSVAATTGVWLVAELEWVTSREPAELPLAQSRLVTADGRSYGGIAPLPASCGPGQPHLTLFCQAPFEVPADALEGAELHIPAEFLGGLDDVAIIDLGIDAARSAELAQPSERLELTGPRELP